MSKKTQNPTQGSSKYDMSFIDDGFIDDHSEQPAPSTPSGPTIHIDHKDDDYDASRLENFHANIDFFSDSYDYYSDDYRPNKRSMNIPSFNARRPVNHGHNQNRCFHSQYKQRHSQSSQIKLSPEDQYRKRIADENRKIVQRHPELIDWNGVKTIGIDHHFNIPKDMNRKCRIRVFDCSTIRTAIDCHSGHPNSRICLLNFANPVKPGGGYLNGRPGQEGSICRQTLLYPTLEKSYMYYENQQRGNRPEASDIMVYSPNVMAIRDDNYEMINHFPVDIISAAAVDNSKAPVRNCEEIMENRIKKIILTAASEKAEILILGAFGCGIFKNNPTTIARIFKKILVEENYQRFFHLVIFPIYNDTKLYQVFNSILAS